MMKQKLFLTIALLLGILAPHSVLGYGYDFYATAPTGQRLYYNITNSSTRTVSVVPQNTSSPCYSSNAPSGVLEIPASVTYSGKTYSVTSIGYAFYNCTSLTSVTIPNSVTSIGDHAFESCSGLTGTLTIPNSVTSIGQRAFSGCTGLTSVTIGNSVTSIGQGAFSGCTGLTSVTIPDSVTSIGYSAFYGCTGLTSVTIPESVTSIGRAVFAGCTGLTSITIPNSVTSIGDSAFSYCAGLTSVTIPNSVTSIGSNAFKNCTGLTTINYNAVNCNGNGFSYNNNWLANCTALTTVNIGDSVSSIPNCAFSGCTGLNSVTIGNAVTSIGNAAFSGCTGLTSVTIPDSVTSIGDRAFYNCSSLTSVTIPDSVTSIGKWAFYHCTGLTTINYNAVNCSGYGFYYDYHWLSGCSALTTLNIGNSVKKIPSCAFMYCSRLTGALTIPNSVTSIGSRVFYGCTGLTSITVPNSVTSIADETFSGCTGLTSVTIGNSVTYIGTRVFRDCTGLTSVTIPNSVRSFGYGVFRDCTGLTSVTIPNSVTNITDSLFYGCTGLTSVTIPNSVTRIGNYAFKDCMRLTSVTIPNSVTGIGNAPFAGCIGLTTINYNAVNCQGVSSSQHWLSGCTALTTVNIGNSVARIPNYAFYNCTSLNSVTLPNSVTSIGAQAFSGCTGLTSVTIPNSVTSIGAQAFSGCTGLTSVTIPNSVTSIGGAAFQNCTGLTTINYNATNCSGDGFTLSNGSYSWLRGCSSLTRVNVGNNVRSIPLNAFYNCTSLHVLDLGSGLTSVGANAFYNCDHLDSIYSRSTTPPTVANTNAFENVWKGLPLTVPTGSRSAYAVAYAWRDFTNIVEMSAAQFTVTVNVNDASMGTVSGGGTYAQGATATLTATPNTGYTFTRWQDGNTDNPRTVTVTGNATYMAYFAADQSNAPQIAYVGVDSNGHNAVSWTPQAGTSPVRYNVYREGIQAGVYELVGVVNASGAASYSWTDDQSNPATRAYSYRLAEVAADNTESDLSIPHTTIHLQISQGQGDAWNLAWTPYVGFNYSTYNLYRGTDASSMTLLTTLPATATTYSDLNTGGTAYYYQIEVVQLSGAKTTAVSSRSNIVTTDPDPQTYTLTVLSADVLRGTVSGGGSYTEGTMATLTAEANEGYVFLQWQDGSTANPRNILVTANGTYMAYFTQTEGIADAEGNNVTIIARNGRIQVSGAEGRQVMLSDALGRILYRGTAMEPLTVEAPATGIYLLQVEGHPAHRISVVR